MDNTIHVDADALSEQIAALKNLVDDKAPLDFYHSSISGALSQSSGDAVEIIEDINTELNETVVQMYLLMQRTLDFLTNTHTKFIEADEGLAEQIENNGPR